MAARDQEPVADRMRRAEAARRDHLARLVQRVRPVVEALHRLRVAQETGVGADQVLATAELVAAAGAVGRFWWSWKRRRG
jgi:hypothetical protein